MSDPSRDDPGAHERRRLQIAHRTAAAGGVAGAIGAVGVGLLGASGHAGLAVLLAVTAAGCVAAALLTAALAVVDEYRRVTVTRRRILTALGLFLAGAALLVLSAGAVATA